MSFRAFFKQCVMRFFIITTCVTAATALLGDLFMPGKTFGFSAFYSPLIAGLLGSLPAFVLYSKKELGLKQTIVRQLINLLLLVVLLTTLAWLNGNISDIRGAVLFVGMVLAVYFVVTAAALWLERKDAKEINDGLKRLQNRS